MAEYSPNSTQGHTPTTEDLLAQLRGTPAEPLGDRDRLHPPTIEECAQRETERHRVEAEFHANFAAETARRQQQKEEQSARLAGTVISLADWKMRRGHLPADGAKPPYSQQR